MGGMLLLAAAAPRRMLRNRWRLRINSKHSMQITPCGTSARVLLLCESSSRQAHRACERQKETGCVNAQQTLQFLQAPLAKDPQDRSPADALLTQRCVRAISPGYLYYPHGQPDVPAVTIGEALSAPLKLSGGGFNLTAGTSCHARMQDQAA